MGGLMKEKKTTTIHKVLTTGVSKQPAAKLTESTIHLTLLRSASASRSKGNQPNHISQQKRLLLPSW